MNKCFEFRDRVIRKIDDLIKKNKSLTAYRKSKLKSTYFSIISNNCWGGLVYQYYGIPYNTPTIGGYFFGEDYIRFVNNLEYYLQQDMEIIDIPKSKWAKQLYDKGHQNVPIGKIGDIEYIFLHYDSSEDALEKWNKRKQRVNYDELLVKYSEGIFGDIQKRDELTTQFDMLPYQNKICFTCKEKSNLKSTVWFKCYKDDEYISFDTNRWRRYININQLINSCVKQ